MIVHSDGAAYHASRSYEISQISNFPLIVLTAIIERRYIYIGTCFSDLYRGNSRGRVDLCFVSWLPLFDRGVDHAGSRYHVPGFRELRCEKISRESNMVNRDGVAYRNRNHTCRAVQIGSAPQRGIPRKAVLSRADI